MYLQLDGTATSCPGPLPAAGLFPGGIMKQAFLVLAALTIALTGCSDDDADDTAGSPDTTQSADATTDTTTLAAAEDTAVPATAAPDTAAPETTAAAEPLLTTQQAETAARLCVNALQGSNISYIYDGDIQQMQAGEAGVQRLEEAANEMAAANAAGDQFGEEAAFSSIYSVCQFAVGCALDLETGMATCPEPADIVASYEG